MDKNIAALLREDAKTIWVTFDRYDTDEVAIGRQRQVEAYKSYCYVTHLPVAVGDTVVVEAAGQIKLAYVVVVNSEVKLEPNAARAYNWVISRIDMAAHEANMKRNKEIEAAVGDAYRNNLRRSFAQQVLAGISDDKRDAIQALISPPTGG